MVHQAHEDDIKAKLLLLSIVNFTRGGPLALGRFGKWTPTWVLLIQMHQLPTAVYVSTARHIWMERMEELTWWWSGWQQRFHLQKPARTRFGKLGIPADLSVCSPLWSRTHSRDWSWKHGPRTRDVSLPCFAGSSRRSARQAGGKDFTSWASF